MKLIYLATPYSKYPGGREQAYKEACKKAAELMSHVAVFCPIAHSHSIELEGMKGDIKDGDWWLKQDFEVLKRCDELWVYQMPGWEDSYGVTREIQFALNNYIPIKMLHYVQENLKVPSPALNTNPTYAGITSKPEGGITEAMDLSNGKRFYDTAETLKQPRNSNYPFDFDSLEKWVKLVERQKALDRYHARDF